MSGLLARLAANLGIVLGVTAVLVLLLIGYVIHLLRGARTKKAAAGAAAPADGDAAAPAPELMPVPTTMRRSFRAAIDALRAYAPAGDHYRIPWFLMLGESDAGKTTALEHAGLHRPIRFEEEQQTAGRGLSWFFFNEGVVLDVDGSLVLHHDGSAREREWETLISLLAQHRPERPLDGFVLVIPATDLTGPARLERDALMRKAGALFERLRFAQRRLGLRLPVFVLISKCDIVSGFSGFVHELPDRLHDGVFGWSAPYSLESAFLGDWVDEAFNSVHADLTSTQIALLAHSAELHDSDGIFRFPHELRSLAKPLRTMLEQVFQESAYHESFFCRGIYFTGDASVQPVAAPPADALGADNPMAQAAAQTAARLGEVDEPRHPIFLRELLQNKLFVESGLARISQQGKRVRSRAVRVAQAAILAMVFIGGPGLLWTLTHLRAERAPVLLTLEEIERDIRAMAPADERARSRDTQVFSLLASMAEIGAGRLWSVFIPRSWFADLHSEIGDNFSAAFERVVLPGLRDGLMRRADRLLDTPTLQYASTGAGVDAAAMPEYDDLLGYLQELGTFAVQVDAYNALTRVGEADLAQLSGIVEYVYGEPLPQNFQQHANYYRRALANATARPITARDAPRYGVQSVTRAGVRIAQVYDRLIAQIDRLGERFDVVFTGADAAAFDVAEIRGLREDIAQVQVLFASSESFWLDPSAPLGSRVAALLDSIPPSALLGGAEFEPLFRSTFEQIRREKLNQFNERLASSAQSAPGPMVDASASDSSRLALAPGLVSLESALAQLFQQGFMQAQPARAAAAPPTAGARVAWDTRPLDQALGYYAEFARYEQSALQGFPAHLQSLVRVAAAQQLQDRTREAVESALTYRSGSASFGLRGAEDALRERVNEFDPAAQRLLRLIDAQNALGMRESVTGLTDLLTAQATTLLGQLDGLLEQNRLYVPADPRFAAWGGQGSVTQQAFSVRDAEQLDAYLAAQRTRVGELATRFAAPLLGYLAAPAVVRSGGTSAPPVQRWRAIVATLDAYENQVAGNQLARLEQYVRTEMDATTPATCAGAADALPAAGTDWFDQQRLRLARALGARCDALALARATRLYNGFRDTFQERLAGRYPFAPVEDAGSEVLPQDLHDALVAYDELAAMRAPVAFARAGSGGAAAAAFLRRFEGVRTLLGPFVDQDSTGAVPASYTFAVDFRVNREREAGADQIADWALDVARMQIRQVDAAIARRGVWQPGDAVRLTLRWATESPRRPIAGGGGRVEGKAATFEYAGTWALLRLVQAHAASPPDLGGRGDAEPHTLRFDVATLADDRGREAEATQTEPTIAFMRVGIFHPLTRARLRIADFPGFAPPLTATQAAP